MSEVHKWHQEKLGLKVVEALKKNRFQAEYFNTKEEARQRLLELIPVSASVGFGGSVSVEQLNIMDELRKRGNSFFDSAETNPSLEERTRVRRLQMNADVYLTGTNALTIDGKLVNEDATGNRVASMIFGPRQVIVIAGINKIVKDVDSALERIEMFAAPMNSRRLKYPNPCAETGVCSDCGGERRICNVITIMRKKPYQTEVTVIVVGEELGL